MPSADSHRRGRPPVMEPETRRRRVLDAAAAIFAEHGYAEASIEEIARACGMSRKTIYGLYPSKEELFSALLTAAVPADDASETFIGADFEESVNRVMDRICAAALAPREIALLRLVIAEARLAPELAAAYYRSTVERGRRFLAAELKRLGAAFGRPADDVEQFADILFGAAVAGPLIHALVGDSATHTPEDTVRRTRRIVAALVRSPPG